MQNKRVGIIGTVGVPANYGGFETLVENLIRYHSDQKLPCNLTIYCSSKSYKKKTACYLSAELKYIPLHANGVQSVLYDMWSLLSAMWRSDAILLLGVSGTVVLPLIRLLSSAKIITNVDGIEWRRQKWRGIARWFLRLSEKIAVRFSHGIIADNQAIADYLKEFYGIDAHVIAYGGDHAINVEAKAIDEVDLPERYAFAVCRIEPENNIHVILNAFAGQQDFPLVMVGNWNSSEYGRKLRQQYSSNPALKLLNPIYDLGKLKTLRQGMTCYVHGHSAGGTNPSLVEAMHFGKPILAYDCAFNRCTTEDKALYFKTSKDLVDKLRVVSCDAVRQKIGEDMREIALRKYTWDIVGAAYYALLLGVSSE